MSRQEALDLRLRQLLEICPDIEAAAVVSVEGVMIAACLPDELGGARFSAMCAAMTGLGERIALELGRGTLEQVVIRGEAGFALLMAIDDASVLTALASEDANLGLVCLDMRRALPDLAGAAVAQGG